MSIDEIITVRGIAEVLHYTTNHGLVGILASRALKCRRDLPSDKYLEHVYEPACADRTRDADWHGYVNMSITRINSALFDIASKKWHKNKDQWWCVLAFDPVILTHPGVVFTTTNNIYSGVIRGRGATGLQRMFAQRVCRWGAINVTRSACPSEACPTCRYAEVLYPTAVSTQHLKRIYVATEEHFDTASGQRAALDHERVEIEINREAFR
jgi:hypothetical protein